MRLVRFAAVLVSLALGVARAAVPTVTITGSVLTPGGGGAVQGTVHARLSQAGTALDGATPQRVAGSVLVNLTAAGALPAGFALVPNDAITPAGTYYEVTLTTRTALGERQVWTERWQLTSSPSSIAIGDVPRLDVVPGVAVGLVPATATVTGGVKLANDLGGSSAAPTVVATHLSAPLPEAQGGSGAATLGQGTVTATGSSTARALQDRAADVVSVKDFGAVGDGVTDDTAAIQAAIDSLPLEPTAGIHAPLGYANGGRVCFPRGRYKVTSTIALRRGVRLSGVSREGSQLISFTPGSVLQYVDDGRWVPDEIGVEDLSIFQDASVTATSGAAIDMGLPVYTGSALGVTVRNVLIQGTYRGVQLEDTIGTAIRDVQVVSPVKTGIRIWMGANARTSVGATIENSYVTLSGEDGISIENGSYIAIVGGTNDANARHGVFLKNCDTVSILGTGAEGNGNSGFYLDGSTAITLAGVYTTHTNDNRFGVTLDSTTNRVSATLAGGSFASSAVGVPGYAIHYVGTAITFQASGLECENRFAGATCTDAAAGNASTFLNWQASLANRWRGGRAGKGRWVVGGTDTEPDATLAIVGNQDTDVADALTVDPLFTGTSTTSSAIVGRARTAASTGANFPLLSSVQGRKAIKGAGSTVVRAHGVYAAEQDVGSSANAALAVGPDLGSIPVGTWAVANFSTLPNLVTGPTRLGSSTGPLFQVGAGTPEGIVTAPVGSVFLRTDGGAATTLYVKEGGTGNTGWVAK